jgi:hypothetical protein
MLIATRLFFVFFLFQLIKLILNPINFLTGDPSLGSEDDTQLRSAATGDVWAADPRWTVLSSRGGRDG